MKKLAGTPWDAITVTLRRLCTGRIRPVLEYGMTAWDTTAKPNFDWVIKVQNQETHIITGAMKWTPIVAMETVTGLQSIDYCRDYKLLTQAATILEAARLPYEAETVSVNKGETEEGSFIHQSRILEWQQEGILDHDPKQISPCLLLFLPGMRELPPSISVLSPVLVRKTPKAALRESLSLRNTFKTIPKTVLDSCLPRLLCWDSSSKWRGRSLHPELKRQRRLNQSLYQPKLHKL